MRCLSQQTEKSKRPYAWYFAMLAQSEKLETSERAQFSPGRRAFAPCGWGSGWLLLRKGGEVMILSEGIKKMSIWGISLFCIFLAINLGAQIPDSLDAKRFDGNNIGMWVWNNGWLARDTTKYMNSNVWKAGFVWPVDSSASLMALAGFWLSAFVNHEFRVAIPDYLNSAFLPGPISDEAPGNLPNPRYRVYKITKKDLNNPGQDYLEWPADLGAPIDSLGKPFLPGNQTIWTIMNDANPAPRTGSEFNTAPLKAEMHITIFDLPDHGLENVVYTLADIYNRGEQTWDSLFIMLYAGTDLGDATDDYAATDTSVGAAFAYNSDNWDGFYKEAPPAMGAILVEHTVSGQKLARRLYSTYIAELSIPSTNNYLPYLIKLKQIYQAPRGIDFLGQKIINPVTMQPTRYVLIGDPVTGEGWLDVFPSGDRELWLNTGPYTVEPNASVTIAYAFCVAKGASNIDSIVQLRQTMRKALEAYQNLMTPTGIEKFETTYDGPHSFRLLRNFPNPFEHETRISWIQNRPSAMKLQIFDINGRLVKTLDLGWYDQGRHQYRFTTAELPSGTYYYRILNEKEMKNGKMIHWK